MPKFTFTPIPICILLAIFANGCAQVDSQARPLVGTWILTEGEDLARRVTSQSNEESSEATPPKMEITFRGNGTLQTTTRMNAIDSQKNGRWKFLSADSEQRTMEIECELDGQTTVCQVSLLDNERIKMTPPNMAGLTMQLTFRREDAENR
jgi:hypothetical protein